MSWKGIISALLIVLCVSEIKAQQQYAYVVSFTDKNNTPYTLSNPIAYLSQRAIDRRTTQGIAVDSTDLPVLDTYIQGTLTASNGILHVKSRWFNSIVILIPSQANIAAVQALPYVSGVNYVGYYALGLHNRQANNNNIAQPVLNAPLVKPSAKNTNSAIQAKSSGSPLYYGNSWDQTTMVNGDYLHDQGYKGQGMLIAVLDDGFSFVPLHEGFDSLNMQNRILETHNFVLDTNYIYDIGSGHGASVLGTIAANAPGDYVGTAPNAEFALYITENLSSEQPVEMQNVVAGIERADSLGADIISQSSGYNTFDNPFNDLPQSDLDGKTTIVAKAANLATSKGILYVATAGNEGAGGLLTPGDADSALTVGAVNAAGSPWSQSGHGPNFAGTIKPDVCTQGGPANVLAPSNSYTTSSGTSFSTPQIAGWAACLWQAYPGATPRMLRAAIDTSAHVHTNPGIQLGYGIPNFQLAANILNIPVTVNKMDSWATIAPNPITDKITLWTDLTISGDVTYSLTDVSGRVLLNNTQKVDSGIRSTPVAVPDGLAPGIYFLKVASGNKAVSIKAVKIN